jgi:hypothetical protein
MKRLLIVGLILMTGSAMASSFTVVGSATCTKGGEERRISMRLFGPKVPCDVIYRQSKDGFKKLQLLADSKTDASTCSGKFHEFQNSLQAEGYNCKMTQNPGGKAAMKAVEKKPAPAPLETPQPAEKPLAAKPGKNDPLPSVPPPTPAKKAVPRVAPTPPPGGKID